MPVPPASTPEFGEWWHAAAGAPFPSTGVLAGAKPTLTLDWWIGVDSAATLYDEVMQTGTSFEAVDGCAASIVLDYRRYIKASDEGKCCAPLAPGTLIDLCWHSHMACPIAFGSLFLRLLAAPARRRRRQLQRRREGHVRRRVVPIEERGDRVLLGVVATDLRNLVQVAAEEVEDRGVDVLRAASENRGEVLPRLAPERVRVRCRAHLLLQQRRHRLVGLDVREDDTVDLDSARIGKLDRDAAAQGACVEIRLYRLFGSAVRHVLAKLPRLDVCLVRALARQLERRVVTARVEAEVPRREARLGLLPRRRTALWAGAADILGPESGKRVLKLVADRSQRRRHLRVWGDVDAVAVANAERRERFVGREWLVRERRRASRPRAVEARQQKEVLWRHVLAALGFDHEQDVVDLLPLVQRQWQLRDCVSVGDWRVVANAANGDRHVEVTGHGATRSHAH
mmetsp:Transcript_26321/g.86135  ORF Transcript_26321/g.86135 Transcript_26321/m.86135 type:complete len:455 (+) Transcript_26321:142-1506(+)